MGISLSYFFLNTDANDTATKELKFHVIGYFHTSLESFLHDF